jgi:TonB family protein
MRRSFIYGLLLATLFLASLSQTVFAQQAAAVSGNINPAEIAKIVRAFSAKETEFRHALNEYAFKRDAVVQTIGMGGQITGEYHRVSYFTFDDSGNRYEKISFFPMPTLTEISLTAEDLEDLGGIQPFALEASKINQYNFNYVGKERIDELNLYVFDVSPKIMPDPKKTKERFFQGRIWVDDKDLQIVKVRGKGVPEDKDNKYPVFDTYREQIDGRYWFPTYTSADDNLVFNSGQVVHLRMLVRYTDFKVGHAEVKITEINGDEPDPTPTPKPTPGTTTTTAPVTQPAPPTEKPQQQMPLTGGVLNDRAIEMPAPKYPESAKQAHIRGVVKVEITIDGEGNVVEAQAVSGPKELRESAVEAAKKARFPQTRLHGQPIKVYGVLTYKFE